MSAPHVCFDNLLKYAIVFGNKFHIFLTNKTNNSIMSKIKFFNPVVVLNGDEMAQTMWKMIKEKLINPYIDGTYLIYDLSIQNRDATNDTITQEAAEAIKKHWVGIKCATITPSEKQVRELGLKKRWPSPNGTIRNFLDGTIFREPIVIKNIPTLVQNWIQPICIGRHAFGDQYASKDIRFTQPGTIELLFTGDNGITQKYHVATVDGPGVAMGMYNTDDSIYGFARASFNQALLKGWPLYFSHKDRILSEYDGRFVEIFREVYENEFKQKMDASGLIYSDLLIDSMVAKILTVSGNIVWACKNYDGDVQSDMLASGFGSLGLMSSNLITPDGKTILAEAAHGTVTDLYKQFLEGAPASANPIASIFAWTRGLAFRGKLDGNKELIEFCQILEQACIKTVEDGVMTRDLAILTNPKDTQLIAGTHFVYTEKFFTEVAENVTLAYEAMSV